MKKSLVSVFMIAGLLSVLLSGCQTGAGMTERAPEPVSSTEQAAAKEEKKETAEAKTTESRRNQGEESEGQGPALPYQFVRKYGIIQSEYPVYEQERTVRLNLPRKEKTISLTSAIRQNQELIVSIILDDDSEAEITPPDGEPPEDGLYYTLSDGSMIASERYQNELWKSGEGLFLTGPGIPEEGIKPLESLYASYPDYYEAYGHKRYSIEARFELPPSPDGEIDLSGYALRVLDFEEPLEFALKRAPEYGTLEELAAEEHGSMDNHDGIAIISTGEKVKEGILVSWYVHSETGARPISITYKPPLQEIDMPTISGNGKQYPIKQLAANPYDDISSLYWLSDVKQYGRRSRCLFDVPPKEQNGAFQVNIPGITFLNHEESTPVTLPIPKDYEELDKDIPWEEGSVRILGITRMKEPQIEEIPDAKTGNKVRERPAVYIDVEAVHEDKNLALRRLICQRKLRYGGWEHERYDFDGKGSLSGFRIFYEEGDREVTLKFNGAAFYWDQPYVMELPLTD